MTITELVEQHLAIAQADTCNAFAALSASQALADAAVLDRLPPGERGPLHGLPVTIKDLFNVYGLPTVAGTRASLPALWPPEAAAVTRLRAAGAVVIGKTNMHEIALGITGENPWTGDVRNPIDPARMSGGSSSGSAAAVRMGAGVVSLGTDTAGSIRLPASFCGVVGFRPTHGRVPLTGALALSPSLDTAGPLARTVEDARRVAEVLLGTPLRVAAPSNPLFGTALPYLEGRLSQGVRQAFLALLAGLRVKEVAFPVLEDASRLQIEVGWPESAQIHETSLNALLRGEPSVPPHASLSVGSLATSHPSPGSTAPTLPGTSALSRPSPVSETLAFPRTPAPSGPSPASGTPAPSQGHMPSPETTGGFSPVILEALLRGRDVSPEVRQSAAEQRRQLTATLNEALREVDALIMPAAPVVAPPRGTTHIDLESGPALLRPSLLTLLVPFSMAGLPVASVPFCEIDGLPVNVQIITRRGEDALCLALAEWFESHVSPARH
ncbi:amidase [Nonomuraea sp. NPDC050556]|uniref:amidase n=1 Tax=Nonomuraea sp. NPDC050556 TaxID=3364369 RepID=UPI0037990633